LTVDAVSLESPVPRCCYAVVVWPGISSIEGHGFPAAGADAVLLSSGVRECGVEKLLQGEPYRSHLVLSGISHVSI
jgi:hypothetical protein